MKSLYITCLAIILNHSLFAGGFSFPNVPYDHAKLYLFNLVSDESVERPDFDVYSNGVYAMTKVGDGYDVDNNMIEEMNGVFAQGIDMMIDGLSKCYTPRHGIIYFDKMGCPVAALSICFECQKISLWSLGAIPYKTPKYSEKLVKKTEYQFNRLSEILEKYKIPVLKNPNEYATHISSNDSLYKVEGEMIFDMSNRLFFPGGSPNTAEVESWFATNYQKEYKWSVNTYYTTKEHDTSHVIYSSTISNGIDYFEFDKPTKNANLISVSIETNKVFLPNGISVGMSLDQLQASFDVWDGLAYPSSILVNYNDVVVRYKIKNRTLTQIKISFIMMGQD